MSALAAELTYLSVYLRARARDGGASCSVRHGDRWVAAVSGVLATRDTTRARAPGGGGWR